jgi:hypothetical protein
VVQVRRQPGPAETRGIPGLVRVARVGRAKIVKDFLEGPDRSFRNQGNGMPPLSRTFSSTRTTRTTRTDLDSDYIFPGPGYIGFPAHPDHAVRDSSDYAAGSLSLVRHSKGQTMIGHPKTADRSKEMNDRFATRPVNA